MDALRKLIEDRGVKQTWLARQIGVDPTLLNHYLHGRRTAPPSFYSAVARAMHVRVSSIRPTPPEPMIRPADPASAEQVAA